MQRYSDSWLKFLLNIAISNNLLWNENGSLDYFNGKNEYTFILRGESCSGIYIFVIDLRV